MFDIKDYYTYDMNRNYKEKTELHLSYRGNADIVMFGNSITEMAEWNELLNRTDIVNRGISGDITSGMLNRIETVTMVEPRVCFILGGINDILKNVSMDSTVSNINKIVIILKNDSVRPVIQSVIYTGSDYPNFSRINEEVFKINNELINIAKTNEIEFIDLNKYLSENNCLKKDYTHDGLHLNAQGYRVWSKILNEFLLINEYH